MNDKLEAFRKRLRGPEKEKAKRLSWIGSPTAWLALVISSTTAFFNLFYYSDELSVAVSPGGPIRLDGRSLTVNPPRSLTFINSGTRPVAVLEVEVSYVQPTRQTLKPDCSRGHFSHLGLDVEATVVKPQEIVVTSSKFHDGRSSVEEATFFVTEANSERSDVSVAECVTFKFVATDTSVQSRTIFMGAYELLLGTRILPRVRKEQVLIKRNRFWTKGGYDVSGYFPDEATFPLVKRRDSQDAGRP
ncbi:hypothetical protein KIP88_19760 [Bradyrhizobium sp. SRL28]|uniref:hypothetical protein n=1 Tax=Bradyrhizobium sp. SRL28 TaxID=2836178 RepID=UPI001BDE19F7|nr:hypothetical protein [Bradyrhizobium sp. SRL28]MBT1512740.1 hypothetical protein [Bradyrhizobium sp. SRL28]